MAVPALRALEQRALALGHVHRRARPFGEIRDAEEVVEVPVRHEDPDTACAEARQRETQLGRVTARIDDDGLVAAYGCPHDVAVGAHRSERQLVDAERHRFGLSSRAAGRIARSVQLGAGRSDRRTRR